MLRANTNVLLHKVIDLPVVMPQVAGVKGVDMHV